MSDKYGQIIEKKYNPDLIKSFQMTWSKFHHTQTEAETTWLIGDIDLVPLQTEWFSDKIEDLPDDVYTHLAYGEIPRYCNKDLKSFEKLGGYVNGGIDLAAYYHAAKGKTFTKALGLDECDFATQIRRVVEDGRFGLGPVNGLTPKQAMANYSYIPIPKEEIYYWVADENYSSYRIHNAHKQGIIEFSSHITPNGYPHDRLDRSTMRNGKYLGNLSQLKNNGYIDIHCDRPYDKQEGALKRVVEAAWDDWYEKE